MSNPALVRGAAGAVLLCIAMSCSQGGSNSRPQSEVKIEATHHMFGFKASATFAEYPVMVGEVQMDRGLLILAGDSSYKVQRDSGTSPALGYALDKTGSLSLLLEPESSRAAASRFRGGYGISGDTKIYFFADDTKPKVGLFWGTPVATTKPDLAGGWHIFALHTLFSKSTVLDPKNVGRTLGGGIGITAEGDLSGTARESTNLTLSLTGTAKTFDNGRVDLAIDFKEGSTTDARVFLAAAGKNVVLGTDEDTTDGEAGLIALVKKRDGRADLTLLRGDYWVGLTTIFVNPMLCGLDGAVGTLTFNDAGGFRIEAVGSKGTQFKFTYTGSYVLNDDGTLVLSVDGTKETWMGAVDQDYKTVILLDNVVEQRSNDTPELNLFIGLRKVVVP